MIKLPTFVTTALLSTSVAIVAVGCEDKAMVKVYDKNIQQTPPSCLALSVIPKNVSIENALKSQYRFDPKCPWRLEVHYKNEIHCNSNQNSDRKALSAFPSSYLRMEIRRGMRLLYSYYLDLPKRADEDDAARGMERILEDIFKK